MRKFSFFTLLLVISCLQGQAQKNTDALPGQTITYTGNEQPGTIQLNASGFGKNKKETAQDAIKRSFEALLFYGIPGSPYSTALLSNPAEQKKHPAVETLLRDGYSGFVLNSALHKEEKLNRKKDGIKGLLHTYSININYDALRKHLETAGVIRKFGI